MVWRPIYTYCCILSIALYGAVEFASARREADVRPIIGTELSITGGHSNESCDFAVVRALRADGFDVSPGVILTRFPGNARQMLAQTVSRIVREQGEKLIGRFVVVQPGHVRISRR